MAGIAAYPPRKRERGTVVHTRRESTGSARKTSPVIHSRGETRLKLFHRKNGRRRWHRRRSSPSLRAGMESDASRRRLEWHHLRDNPNHAPTAVGILGR